MKCKKYSVIAIILALCLCLFACGSTDGGKGNGNGGGGGNNNPPATEGVLTVSNVYQYLGYAKEPVVTRMDGIRTYIPDMYYDIIDKTVCTIEDGYVRGLKVGSTTVYAQTLLGQEVEFTVTIRDPMEFRFNGEVLSLEERYTNVHNSPQHPTLFVGDSFFDTRLFWKTFYQDFEGLNCFSVGISSSETKDWYVARERLIDAYQPKNIVFHIGTNDINATNPALTIDQFYAKITEFLQMIIDEHPTTNIYYLGIENRKGNQAGRNAYSLAVTEKIKNDFAPGKSTFHYIDSPSVFNADQDRYVASDCIHPSAAGYAYYTNLLKELIEF